MIFTIFIGFILNIFGTIFGVVLPALPSDVDRILASIMEYIQQGLNFVWLFLPKKLVLELFQWWIVFASIMLTIELALEVWRLITGNAGGQEATSEGTTLYTDGQTGEVKSVVSRSSHYKSRRTGLPRFYR